MINIGFATCGDFIENAVLPTVHTSPNANAIAVCSRNQDRVNAVCDRFGIKHRCENFKDLLKIDGLDVIYVASGSCQVK